MNRHLTHNELSQIARGQVQELSKNSLRHYDGCGLCQAKSAQQYPIHNLLTQLKPSSAPVHIMENVLEAVSIKPVVKEKERTDWIFFIALFSLFVITVWIIISGSISAETSRHLSPIFQGWEDMIPIPSFIYTLKAGLQNLILSSSVLQDVHLSLYLFWGVLSLAFYFFIDKKFGKAHRI